MTKLLYFYNIVKRLDIFKMITFNVVKVVYMLFQIGLLWFEQPSNKN